MTLPERPRLRNVEAFPHAFQSGDEAVVLRDPLGIAPGLAAIPPPVFALLALFDGRRTIVDVQAEWARRTGQLVFAEQIERFLVQLDEALFLHGERFDRARDKMVEEFRRSPVRPAALAGGAYPADRAELEPFLAELFLRPGGPGRLPGATTVAEAAAVGGATAGKNPSVVHGGQHPPNVPPASFSSASPAMLPDTTLIKQAPVASGRLVGIVAPHIDPRRGNTAYAHAFDAVARAGGADLYVIFGTAHQGGDDLYIFTKKHFETPLGTVETDTAFVERLEARLGRSLDRSELSHRTEHSVEFEVVFLKYVEDRLRRRAAPRIVPFICNSFQPWTETGESPAASDGVARALAALRAEIAEEEARGRRVICIAGADLAHIGPKFGHERVGDEVFRRECEEKDRASLERAVSPDAEGFFGYIAREKDERNICGLPCTYSMLKVLEGDGAGPRAARGELLAYGMAPDPTPGSYVSFCSLAFYG